MCQTGSLEYYILKKEFFCLQPIQDETRLTITAKCPNISVHKPKLLRICNCSVIEGDAAWQTGRWFSGPARSASRVMVQ